MNYGDRLPACQDRPASHSRTGPVASPTFVLPTFALPTFVLLTFALPTFALPTFALLAVS